MHLAPGEEIMIMGGTPDGHDWNSSNILSVHVYTPTVLWTPQSLLSRETSLDTVGDIRTRKEYRGHIGIFHDELTKYLLRAGILPLYSLSRPDEETGIVKEIGLEFIGAIDNNKLDISDHVSNLDSDYLDPVFHGVIELTRRDNSYVLTPNLP